MTTHYVSTLDGQVTKVDEAKLIDFNAENWDWESSLTDELDIEINRTYPKDPDLGGEPQYLNLNEAEKLADLIDGKVYARRQWK